MDRANRNLPSEIWRKSSFKVSLSAHCLYARVAHCIVNQSSWERACTRACARTHILRSETAWSAPRTRSVHDRLPWRARRWLAVDRAAGHPVPNRRGTGAGGARCDAARLGSARGIRCDEDTKSGVNGLSLVNGDRTFSVNVTNGYGRGPRAREILTTLTLTLRDALDATCCLIFGLKRSLNSSIIICFFVVFFY